MELTGAVTALVYKNSHFSNSSGKLFHFLQIIVSSDDFSIHFH